MVLLRGELEEPVEAVARLYRRQVDEVARLGPSEDCENLVDGEFLAAQRWRGLARFCRKEPRVGSQIELGALVAALDDQARKARTHLNMSHDESRL